MKFPIILIQSKTKPNQTKGKTTSKNRQSYARKGITKTALKAMQTSLYPRK